MKIQFALLSVVVGTLLGGVMLDLNLVERKYSIENWESKQEFIYRQGWPFPFIIHTYPSKARNVKSIWYDKASGILHIRDLSNKMFELKIQEFDSTALVLDISIAVAIIVSGMWLTNLWVKKRTKKTDKHFK